MCCTFVGWDTRDSCTHRATPSALTKLRECKLKWLRFCDQHCAALLCSHMLSLDVNLQVFSVSWWAAISQPWCPVSCITVLTPAATTSREILTPSNARSKAVFLLGLWGLFSFCLPEAEEFDSIVSVTEKLDEQVSLTADERSQSDLQTPASLYFIGVE